MSVPTPVAKSMATQVTNLYCGREWSGPSRTPPSADSATQATKRITTVTVST